MRAIHAWAITLAMLGGVCLELQAQTLPKPREFYFDEDRNTTRAIVAIAGQGDAVIDRLATIVQRDPRAVEARAQLAALAFAGGRRELGEQLYQAVLGSLPGSGQQYRTVVWNYGWDLYRAGDPARALQQWSRLAAGRPSAPEWLPPTLALALWQSGRRQEAVAWYAAAVRTWPDRWNNPAHLAALLPDWREQDRAVLAEVLAAWQAAPPAWP